MEKFMKSILEELYFSNDGMFERICSGRDYRKLQNEYCKVFERLIEELNKEQEKMLNELYELSSGMEAEAALAYFKEGFKLCMRLIFEGISK